MTGKYRLRPLYYVSDSDKAWYKDFYGIRYSDAYEVYGLTRTGCCGCPISYKAVEDLEKKLNKAMDELKECQGILVCSDLAGGSPFKTAVMCGYPRGNVEIIAGSNLPMLIEVNMGRQFVEELEMLTNMAINTGKDQVMRYEFKPVEQEEPTEGI